MTATEPKPAGWKAKLKEELTAMSLIALYIYLTLTALRFYRALIEGRDHIDGFELGATLIESLVMAKVIILGDLLKVSQRFRDDPAIVPTLFRSFIFAIFILIFSSLELFVKGLIHGDAASVAFDAVLNKERGIRLAQAGFMFLAFIPLYATWEISRHIGEKRLVDIFFHEREPSERR